MKKRFIFIIFILIIIYIIYFVPIISYFDNLISYEYLSKKNGDIITYQFNHNNYDGELVSYNIKK